MDSGRGVLFTLTDSPQRCWEASLSSTSSSTTNNMSSRANAVPYSRERHERLPEGQSGQELIDCLGEGGTPSNVADLE